MGSLSITGLDDYGRRREKAAREKTFTTDAQPSVPLGCCYPKATKTARAEPHGSPARMLGGRIVDDALIAVVPIIASDQRGALSTEGTGERFRESACRRLVEPRGQPVEHLLHE